MEELIKKSEDLGFTIGLLGGRDGVAELAAERLLEKYPKLKVVFAKSGGEVDNDGNVIARNEMTEDCDILFVAFGPPKQEKWIAKNLKKIPVKVAMTVGGSLDIISGKIPRAPKILRTLGLEWIFRLIMEPWRVKRQLALIEYLLLILKYGKYKNSHLQD